MLWPAQRMSKLSPDAASAAGENGGRRRRSTFYVPLASDCVKGHSSKGDAAARRTASSAASGRKSSSTVDLKKATSRHSCGSGVVTKLSPRAVVPSICVESPKGGSASAVSSQPVAAASKSKSSPLLRVSSRLLSSSVQALEALGNGGGGSSNSSSCSINHKVPERRSPLSLIRKSSSRKLPRSSSNASPRGVVSKSAKCECAGPYIAAGLDVSDADIIAIDEPPDLRLLETYVRGGAEDDCGGRLANGELCDEGSELGAADERDVTVEEEEVEGAREEEVRERLLAKEREDRDDGVHSGKYKKNNNEKSFTFSCALGPTFPPLRTSLLPSEGWRCGVVAGECTFLGDRLAEHLSDSVSVVGARCAGCTCV